MDPAHLLLLIQIILLLGLMAMSAIFSGSETALFSLNNPTLNNWRDHGTPGQKLASRLMQDHHATLTVILLGNNFVNILSSILFSRITNDYLGSTLGSQAVLVAGFIITAVLLIFCEVTPKSVAYAIGPQIAPLLALPLSWMLRVLHPAVRLLKYLSGRVLVLVGSSNEPPGLTPEEYQSWIGLGRQLGVFSHDEVKLLQQVFKLRNRSAAAAMTPRVDMQTIDISNRADEVEHLIGQFKHRRVPVIDGDLDHLVGVLHVKTFVLASVADQANWVETCVVKPIFMPEQAELSDVLARLRSEGQVMAFVVDEYGGVAGLITVEDILEQIVGELGDEYNDHQFQIAQILDGYWRVNAQMGVDEWLDHRQMNLPEHDADTLGGLVSEMLDHIPEVGEHWDCDGYRFLINKAGNNRVQEIDIIRLVAEPVATTVPATADHDDDDEDEDNDDDNGEVVADGFRDTGAPIMPGAVRDDRQDGEGTR